MVSRSNVLLAAAAVYAALFLQGCDVPAFVYGQCEAALEPTVAQASTNGLQMVQTKCRYLEGNQRALVLAIQKDLDTAIGNIVAEHYDTAFGNRAVPAVIKAQCENAMETNMPTGLLNTALAEMQKQCSEDQRSATWIAACQEDGIKKMFATKAEMLAQFVEACAKSVLEQECPKGSICAIDTNNADTFQTELFANSFTFLHKTEMLGDLNKALLNDAGEAKGRLLAQPRTSRLFGAFEVPTKHVKTGLLVWAGAGALVAGAGLLVVALAAVRVLRKRATRSFNALQEAPEEELLVVA